MKRSIVRIIGIVAVLARLTLGSIAAYMWFKPHRNVSQADAMVEVSVASLVEEFTKDPSSANAKYLSSDGNSMVLILRGTVSEITTNLAGEKVLFLKEPGAKVGAVATFTRQSSSEIDTVHVGQLVRVKGAITTGNSYDADLDIYSDAVFVQCTLAR